MAKKTRKTTKMTGTNRPASRRSNNNTSENRRSQQRTNETSPPLQTVATSRPVTIVKTISAPPSLPTYSRRRPSYATSTKRDTSAKTTMKKSVSQVGGVDGYARRGDAENGTNRRRSARLKDAFQSTERAATNAGERRLEKRCKQRPDSKEARKGNGTSRAFIPWCKK